MGTFTLTFLVKKMVLLLRYCGRRSSRYFILMQYKLKMLQFIPNAPIFLWAMSDAHSRMIHSFESILFKGLIKPVNRFANQFEWFVQFPAARAELSERFSLRVVTSRVLKTWLCIKVTVNWKQICKGYWLLAMKIFIRWTLRVLSTVPQV